MATNFADMMKTERDRLTGALDDVQARMDKLNEEAAGYKRELAAIDAYERTKTGKTTAPTTSTRAARGSRSDTLLAMIGGTDGMTRSQILEEIGAKGNKSLEGSISNALATMKKKGQLNLKDGTYTVAA